MGGGDEKIVLLLSPYAPPQKDIRLLTSTFSLLTTAETLLLRSKGIFRGFRGFLSAPSEGGEGGSENRLFFDILAREKRAGFFFKRFFFFLPFAGGAI